MDNDRGFLEWGSLLYIGAGNEIGMDESLSVPMVREKM